MVAPSAPCHGPWDADVDRCPARCRAPGRKAQFAVCEPPGVVPYRGEDIAGPSEERAVVRGVEVRCLRLSIGPVPIVALRGQWGLGLSSRSSAAVGWVYPSDGGALHISHSE